MAYPVDTDVCFLIEPYGTSAGRTFPHTGDDWARKKIDGKAIVEVPNVYAAHSGTVIAAGWHAQAGWRTVIAYWFGRFGVYAHQAKLLVAAGATVKERQLIGLLGGTGETSGPHLHYSEFTNQARALSGIVPYWKNSAGQVLWQSVDAWAASFGLVRPDYKLTDKAAAADDLGGFLMALTDKQQGEIYEWLKGLAFGTYPREGAVAQLLSDAAQARFAAEAARDALTKPVDGFAPIDVIRTHVVATLKAVREQAAQQGVDLDEDALAQGVLDALGKRITNG